MKMILISALAVLTAFGTAAAQTTKIVVGPLEGDSAGTLYAHSEETIEVEVWIRTAPGVQIIAFHFPLATKDDYIRSDSRSGSDALFPLPLWDEGSFLIPNEDAENQGYTNQSYLGLKDFRPGEDPDTINAIWSEDEFINILQFEMTIADSGFAFPLNDAFIIGHQPDNGYMAWVDYPTDEMNNSEIEVSLAPLAIDIDLDAENEINIPVDYALSQNYPNPFNASTTISYSLPQESEVSLDIYDIMGRKIETLVPGRQPAGEHSVVWNADHISSGVYLFRINAGSYSETRRCNLIK